MNNLHTLKAAHTLAEKQLAKAVAEAKEEPPRRQEKGKLPRVTARAKEQRAAKKAAKQAEYDDTEQASAERAEARQEAKRAAEHEAAKR